MPCAPGNTRDTRAQAFAVNDDVLSISFEESGPMNVKHMKRAIGAAVACTALAAGVVAGSHKATASQSAKTPAREVPRFEADASWAKIPNGWVFGQVASAATDEQDHVWVSNASSCSMQTRARTSGCGARSATSRPTTLPPPQARS